MYKSMIAKIVEKGLCCYDPHGISSTSIIRQQVCLRDDLLRIVFEYGFRTEYLISESNNGYKHSFR